MRRMPSAVSIAAVTVLLAGCGGGTKLLTGNPESGVQASAPQAAQKLGFPSVATKNTTRVGGGDAVADAAAVALAVYPSAAAGTHPTAVTIAPSDDWQASIAAAVLMAPPIRAPILLSGSSSLPSATSDALGELAPTGSGAAAGAQVIRIGNVPSPERSALHLDSGQRPVRARRGHRPLRERSARQDKRGRRDRLGR